MEILTKSVLETEKLGEDFADKLILKQVQDDGNAKVVCLYGELGSGKTTFTRGFARGLSIKQRILSPTFIIIRQYKIIRKKILKQVQDDEITDFYHLDLYRIEKLEGAKSLGIEEILGNIHNLVLIEWPEIIKEILPKKRTEIYFKYLKENERSIIICHFDRGRQRRPSGEI